jgi:hypothetical protein
MFFVRPVLAGLMLFGTACNQDRIARLEKQNQELAVKVDSVRKAGTLDLQAKCASQARVAFNESGLRKEERGGLSGYTNHYNRTLNRCFVEFSDTKPEGNGLATYKSVQDAFEGKVYGEYYWSNAQGRPGMAVKPTVCTVTLLSGEDKYCESDKEFEELLKVYMEQ